MTKKGLESVLAECLDLGDSLRCNRARHPTIDDLNQRPLCILQICYYSCTTFYGLALALYVVTGDE